MVFKKESLIESPEDARGELYDYINTINRQIDTVRRFYPYSLSPVETELYYQAVECLEDLMVMFVLENEDYKTNIRNLKYQIEKQKSTLGKEKREAMEHNFRKAFARGKFRQLILLATKNGLTITRDLRLIIPSRRTLRNINKKREDGKVSSITKL